MNNSYTSQLNKKNNNIQKKFFCKNNKIFNVAFDSTMAY